MNRYNKIEEKIKREIVLLKGLPCFWGKCKFCDYTLDNSRSIKKINETNSKVIDKITGEFKVLEVINSGSCFEIPKDSLEMIREKIEEKKIEHLFLESHWNYRHRLDEMRDFFKIPITFKIGVETFDNNFRNNILNKNAKFQTPIEVSKYFDSACILVGIEGQSKEMIKKDINILLRYFEHGTINIFTENTTSFKRDEKLINWFIKEYSYLNKNKKIDILYDNTDFGVGD